MTMYQALLIGPGIRSASIHEAFLILRFLVRCTQGIGPRIEMVPAARLGRVLVRGRHMKEAACAAWATLWQVVLGLFGALLLRVAFGALLLKGRCDLTGGVDFLSLLLRSLRNHGSRPHHGFDSTQSRPLVLPSVAHFQPGKTQGEERTGGPVQVHRSNSVHFWNAAVLTHTRFEPTRSVNGRPRMETR